MKEWETEERSVCVCGSALPKASTYDLQMRGTSRAPEQNNRRRQRKKTNTKIRFISLQPHMTLLSLSRAHSSDEQQHRHVRERRMEWRVHEHERGAGRDWEWTRTWTRTNGRDAGWGGKGMLERETGGSGGVSSITDLTAAHIQSAQPACHHQPVQQKTAAAPPMPACTRPLLCTTAPEEFVSSFTSQLSVLRPLLSLWSHQNHFSKKNNNSSKGHNQKR